MWYAYLLLCKDKTFYAGCTNNLQRRLNLHRLGKASRYTRSRGAVKIIYAEAHRTKTKALAREYQIKQLSRGQKIELSKNFKPFKKLKLPL